MTKYIVAKCYNCGKLNAIDETEINKKCSCSGELKFIKAFNNKEEAENYIKYLKGEFKFLNQT